jgi:SAM-dependent MidA family methyltransferase
MHMPDSSADFTRTLHAWLQAAPGGVRRWDEVMDRALYDPAMGYYGAGPRRLGRAGDFYTAVTVGALYGRLLAQVVLDTWQAQGSPAGFTVVEQGAHDGQLMADLGAALPAEIGLCIIEARDAFRQAQQAKLSDRVQWVHDWSPLVDRPTMLVCNELLDALPVRRVRRAEHGWEEAHVGSVGDAFAWQWLPCVGAIPLPHDLPIGYTTELHDAALHWMQEVVAQPNLRAVLLADYGHEADAYYQSERASGTLRRYAQHRSDAEVLTELGLCDLTAHVNFTPIIDAASGAGFAITRFMEQGRFLTHAAGPWLRSLEGQVATPAVQGQMRQFHTLTHPSHMGAAFKVLWMQR